MSASDKKKLRKEQTAAILTEKQQTQKKEQKKLKNYTFTFIIAMILVVAVVVVSALQMPVKNLLMKNTVALTIGENKIDAAQFNYFYTDTISEFYNQFSDYGDYADLYFQLYYQFDPTKAVGDQVFNSESGETWADYFISAAVESATWTYAMYDKAMEANFELSEDDQKSMDSMASYISLYATWGGYSSTDAYLKGIYGGSATMDSYTEYYELCTIASAYATEYAESLEYTDEQYREYEADRYHEFCSYSWYSYPVYVSSYLTGGETVTGEDGKTSTVYSDEEKAAALEKAEADAKALAEGAFADLEAFNAALNALEINADAEKAVKATEYETVLYSSISAIDDVKEWLTDAERAAGDMTYIAKTSGEGENETTDLFYVLYYVGCEENKMSIGTVRHLLVKFEGGTEETDEDGNKTTVYSDKEKAAAELEANDLLQQFLDGEKVDEEAFTALVKKHTDDTGTKTTGGLIENITPDSGYVENFTLWATADHEPGDTGVIETEYGFHVMYYVESYELNYRDMLIKNEMLTADYEAWEKEILDQVTATVGDMKYVNRDLVMSSN